MIATPRFQRQAPEASAPDRHAGGLFRTAGAGVAGLPLDSLESVAVAAVRTGYRVADAHVLRVQELGRRMHEACEQAVGEEPERKALEATEGLLERSVLAWLGLLEGATAEAGGALHHVLAAKARWLAGACGPTCRTAACGRTCGAESPCAAPCRREPPDPPARQPAPGCALRVRHVGEVRRRVLVVAGELRTSDRAAAFDKIAFFHAQDLAAAPLAAAIRPTADVPTLELDMARTAPAGLWNAAVCTDDGTQVGWVQIEI